MAKLYRFSFFYLFICLLCVGGKDCHPGHIVYVEVRRQPEELVLLFHHVGPGIKFRLWLGSQCPYRLLALLFLFLLSQYLRNRSFLFLNLFSLYISSYRAMLCLNPKNIGLQYLFHLSRINQK